MSSEVPEPFKMRVERPNGEQSTYVLMRKDVVLRRGKTRPIYYFVREISPSQPDLNSFEYRINEMVRGGVTDESLLAAGRAMMEYFGMSAEVAAEVNGRFAAEVRGCGKEERSKIVEGLRGKLAEPPH